MADILGTIVEQIIRERQPLQNFYCSGMKQNDIFKTAVLLQQVSLSNKIFLSHKMEILSG